MLMVLRILNCIYGAILITVVVGGAWLIANIGDYPTVSFSHTTGECVRVIGGDGQYGCDSLPGRYIHSWVK